MVQYISYLKISKKPETRRRCAATDSQLCFRACQVNQKELVRTEWNTSAPSLCWWCYYNVWKYNYIEKTNKLCYTLLKVI